MKKVNTKKRYILAVLTVVTFAPALTFAASVSAEMPNSCNTPLERREFLEWKSQNGAPESFPCETETLPESSEPLSRPELPEICNTPSERQAFLDWILNGSSSEPLPCNP